MIFRKKPVTEDDLKNQIIELDEKIGGNEKLYDDWQIYWSKMMSKSGQWLINIDKWKKEKNKLMIQLKSMRGEEQNANKHSDSV